MLPANPKISIIMPSFNQGPYLEAAIRSVLSQDYANKQLIVIDGGSTDNSMEIIQRYQQKLAYSVSEPDLGQADALNKGLSQVTGDIIGWLNSDDCYLPGAFRSIVRAFQKNPNAVVVHGDRIMIDRNGHVSGWTALPAFDPATTGYTICSETVFWRKTGTNDLHFDETLRFAMDVDFFGHLHRRGPFVKLNAYLGAFRCHAANKSSTIIDVGHTEGQALWRIHFPDHPDGWKNKPPPGKLKMLFSLLRHPFIIALPYLYRRFCLGLRGTQTRDR